MRIFPVALAVAVLWVTPVDAQRASCSVGEAARQCQIPPRSATLIPADSVGGDMEFAGHPVDISVRATRRLNADSSSVVVDLEMVAVEVVKDSTWIAGTDSVVLFAAESGWRIRDLPDLSITASDRMGLILGGKDPLTVLPARVRADRERNEGRCRRHATDVCRTTTDLGVVARWIVWGDSDTRDLGQTRMTVDLASLGVRVERRASAVVSQAGNGAR